LFDSLYEKVQGKGVRIVFPEGMDQRIILAAAKLKADKMVEPIVLGNKEEVLGLAKESGVIFDGIEIIDPLNYEGIDALVAELVELRKGKNTEEQVRGWLTKGNYFGTMLVKAGLADGLVGGATYSTADTVRPSLQIIKTKPGIKKVSSAFIMLRGQEKYVMGDCAINIAPTSDDLAEIARECAKTAEAFDIDPRVALLSFSTKGSAKSPEVEKVEGAYQILKEAAVNFEFDGELQFDAAFVETVGKKKAPESTVAGTANTFVFPSLEAGNIGYKIAQRLGGFEAVGPILQGLNAPINDLSRGCNVDEIYKLSVITAVQHLQK
jgi:phosphate acetyltransferase